MGTKFCLVGVGKGGELFPGRAIQMSTQTAKRRQPDISTTSAHALWVSRSLERFVIPALMNFVEEQTEHRFPLFRTDINVIRSEDLMEFVLVEKLEW